MMNLVNKMQALDFPYFPDLSNYLIHSAPKLAIFLTVSNGFTQLCKTPQPDVLLSVTYKIRLCQLVFPYLCFHASRPRWSFLSDTPIPLSHIVALVAKFQNGYKLV